MILPLFRLDYMDRWISMESTYVGDVRFLAEHWPHPRWQPLWYGGTRFDYLFPPVMRYAPAALVRVFNLLPARAYHLAAALFYCAGIVGMYALVRVRTRERAAAWMAALCTLLLSPALIFIPRLYVAGWHRAPQRIVLLTQWGEGSHMAALAMIPLALACALLAFERHRPAALAGTALLSAGIVSSDFYGATAWFLFFAILLWSFWITHQQKVVFARAAAIVVLSFALTAFWLVPSFLFVIFENLRLTAQPATSWSVWIFLAVASGYMLLSDRYARGRPELVWNVFVLGAVAIFTLYVLANEYSAFRIAGDPSRLVPEFELVLVLAIVEGLRRLWSRPVRAARIAAAALVLGSLASAAPYIRRHKVFFPRDWHVEQRPESQIQEWLRTHLPGARALVAGSVRLWYDTWHDLPQLGGGADLGVNNGLAVAAQWQVLLGDQADISVEWMRCLGVDAVAVNGPDSKEMYHDFKQPRKFAGKLPVLFDNHQGDIVYGVPRRFPGIARVVETARLAAVKPFQKEPDLDHLRVYSAVLEQGPDAPATVTWQGSDAFRAHAWLQPGQALLIQESWDTAWRAWSAGREVPLARDPMGFILASAPPGEQDIRFAFTLPLENAIGRAVTLLAFAALAAWCIRGYVKGR
jgi:hypothetical protein